MAVTRYEVSVRTRSSDRDYSWVGSAPHEWWLSGWGDSLLRRGPYVMQDIVDGHPQLLLAGIECARRDGTGAQTRIRYELLFTPKPRAAITDGALLAILEQWWDQRTSLPNTAWPLGEAIDGNLAILAAQQGKTVDGLIEFGERAAMQSSIAQLVPGSADRKRRTGRPDLSWVGAESVAIRDVLFGDSPFAYFPSTPKLEAEAPDHLGVRDGVTLIVDGESGQGGRDASPKGWAPAGVTEPSSMKQLRARLLLTTLALVLALAVLLTVVLI